MGKNQLEEATKKAARQEKERVARILERQKLVSISIAHRNQISRKIIIFYFLRKLARILKVDG